MIGFSRAEEFRERGTERCKPRREDEGRGILTRERSGTVAEPTQKRGIARIEAKKTIVKGLVMAAPAQ